METNFIVKAFHELSGLELYEILRLRSEVFVVEQNCVYQDMDDKDQDCYHLICYRSNSIAAYARIIPAGISYNEVSIGRVVTAKNARGLGLGKVLIAEAVKICAELFPDTQIRIGAQLYLLKFYNSLGFVEQGEPYDEDGISHIEMVKE
ncbi:GNAT family N-acetyltransferase [Chryseobacterium scophthalmum]|uniref:GNAT family N-acetyltransferase n=1 Tax=Chryseobacterium scophthalmum TaxID=59733 RepID=UPI001AEBB092|nr:GNAT family N-acetyltransferase [Chryseobacterium scophthalmum]